MTSFIACCSFIVIGRDRNGDAASIRKLLVVGDRLDKRRVAAVTEETLGVRLQPLGAAEVGLSVPGELPFDTIAAPAGLARLAW